MHGQLTRAETILRELLAEMKCLIPRTTAGALVELAVQRAWLFAERKLPFLRSCVEPEALSAMRAVALGFAMIDNLRAASFQTRWLRGALASGDDRIIGQALALEGIFRGSLDLAGRKEGYDLVRRAEALASSTKDPELDCWARAARATLDALGMPSRENVAALEAATDQFRTRTRGNGWAITSLTLVGALSARLHGDFHGVRKLVASAVADARSRSDLYLETTLRRGSSFLRLVDDDPDSVAAELEATRWESPYPGFHFQHWLALDAVCETDLYRGEGHHTLERCAAEWRMMRRSLVLRQQRVRVLSKSLEARLLLAQAHAGIDRVASLESGRRLARELIQEGLSYAALRGQMALAGVFALEGRDALANDALRAVVSQARAEGLDFLSAAAASRLGRRIGGDEGDALLAEAEGYFKSQRVRNAARMTAVEAPFY